ncbi:CASC3/Barentsz eIF4AIII binding protein [Ancylostoma caninum]|uniref:Protein CASC3 n=1 Tax=Ancylostoma caninum TaxID=29170 RepID=A0A368HCW0_ANCCA|nr:CASC3/Barentsz eIF4AIII binding protein [Ancylostoma caninum]
MSEEAATTPSAIAENGEKSAEDQTTEKMAEMKPFQPRENGDDGFHTPEATDEGQKEGEAGEPGETTKLDDDEIEDNPAYIPRKGRYYMHDSRDAEEEVEEEKKTSRADGTWKHDRFDERWQRPKTKKQIMTRYGFDIREGETQEEAEENQRKRQAEKVPSTTGLSERQYFQTKKEGAGDAEASGEKRRAKKTPKAKPRPRTEGTGSASTRTRPQKIQKSEKQSTDERPSQEGGAFLPVVFFNFFSI